MRFDPWDAYGSESAQQKGHAAPNVAGPLRLPFQRGILIPPWQYGFISAHAQERVRVREMDTRLFPVVL